MTQQPAGAAADARPAGAPAFQLISYIAPAAPATRRPATGTEPFLRPEVGFTPRWYREAAGIEFDLRWHTDVRYRRETVLAMRAELERRFPGTCIGGIDRPDAPLDLLTGVYGANVVAALFGLPIVYAPDNWPNVEHRYLTREEMGHLTPPDLDSNPFFHDLMRQLDAIEEREGRIEGFVNWQGVLNNAQRLRGPDLFMDMAEAPELCHHLFGTVCQTMISGIQRLHTRQRASGVEYSFATVSNCLVNMVSPDQYREYLLPYDIKIAETFAVIGVHNCAWNADPYMDDYARVPGLAYIDMGFESKLARARQLYPHARRALMYTPMDLANQTETALRASFERIASEYGPCDIVLADIEAGTPDSRVRFAVELCTEISRAAGL